MNVKNKVIAIFMSFVICFCTVGNSFANDKKIINNIDPMVVGSVTISAPLLAVVSTSAVAVGYTIKNSDDIYSIGERFYNTFKDNWSDVVESFNTNISIATTGAVLIGSTFLNYLKSFFQSESANSSVIGYYGEMPVYYSQPSKPTGVTFNFNTGKLSDMNKFYFSKKGYFQVESNGALYVYGLTHNANRNLYSKDNVSISAWGNSNGTNVYITDNMGYKYAYFSLSNVTLSKLNGTYDDSIIDKNKDEEGTLGVYVPGKLDDLVGVGSSDVLVNGGNPSYDLPIGGVVSLPGNSYGGATDLEYDDTVSLPGFSDTPTDTPNEGLFASIKDFIISLVVPTDTFWTDTFNGFRDNFSKNFPMLDMSKFDSLAVGGKPFPNLYAYGSKIVDGDVINSIVDWLRPIIAGFIMICLMFFNYRKIYKLIRNTEPFGGIAPGSSEFSTGLRDPEYRQTVREFRSYMAREGGGK